MMTLILANSIHVAMISEIFLILKTSLKILGSPGYFLVVIK